MASRNVARVDWPRVLWQPRHSTAQHSTISEWTPAQQSQARGHNLLLELHPSIC